MHRITGTITLANQTAPPEYRAGAGVWDVELRFERRTMRVAYHTGPFCGAPTLAEVVACVAGDTTFAINNTFQEWCEEMGYDTDSRSAERSYHECLAQGRKLRKLLGSSGLFEALVCGEANTHYGIRYDDDVERRAERVVIEPDARRPRGTR